jgi:hypothetical protein
MKYRITSMLGIAAALAVAGLATQAPSNHLPRCVGRALAATPASSVPRLHLGGASEEVESIVEESLLAETSWLTLMTQRSEDSVFLMAEISSVLFAEVLTATEEEGIVSS